MNDRAKAQALADALDADELGDPPCRHECNMAGTIFRPCSALSPRGFGCCRQTGHRGMHVACTPTQHGIDVWQRQPKETRS